MVIIREPKIVIFLLYVVASKKKSFVIRVLSQKKKIANFTTIFAWFYHYTLKWIMVKTGLFLERVYKFRICFKKEVFYNYFSLNCTFSGRRLLPRVNQVTLLQTQRTSDGRMAAQRKGSWKDCSVLLFFDRRLLSLSLFSFSRTTLSTTVQFSCFRPEVYRCL